MAVTMQYAQAGRKCLLHSLTDYARCMESAGERLKQARKKAGYTSAQMAAEAMGISPATYAQHENGLRGYPAAKAERYAKFFRVSPEWLLYGRSKPEAEAAALGPQLFVKGSVAAGVWLEAWEVPEDEWERFTGRSDVGAPLSRRFGLRVVGNSMDLVYPPGTVVECVSYDGSAPVPSGKRVVVVRTKLDGTVEATVKELVRDDEGAEWLVPRSSNPSFQAFRGDRPDEPDIEKIEIVGVIVASIRPE